MISRFHRNTKVLMLTKLLLYRNLHVSRTLNLNPNNVTEIRIPVPWGHIAGKWWGETNEQPILAIHGWQDNASSFDNFLELLESSKPVLAIDSPGHGFSSHFPPPLLYQNTDYIMVIRRIQKYFKWNKKMTIMGHSEGGIIAFLFAAIYPECVNALVTFDVIKPIAPSSSFYKKLGLKIDKYIEKSKRETIENPRYSLDEIVNRWVKATRGSLTPEAVKVLLRRGSHFDRETNTYSLTRDHLLKIGSFYRFSEDQCLEFARNLNCHYLAIKFSNGAFFDYSLRNSPNFISTLDEVTKSFELVTVQGTHHGHLTNPENVVPVVSKFLQSSL